MMIVDFSIVIVVLTYICTLSAYSNNYKIHHGIVGKNMRRALSNSPGRGEWNDWDNSAHLIDDVIDDDEPISSISNSLLSLSSLGGIAGELLNSSVSNTSNLNQTARAFSEDDWIGWREDPPYFDEYYVELEMEDDVNSSSTISNYYPLVDNNLNVNKSDNNNNEPDRPISSVKSSDSNIQAINIRDVIVNEVRSELALSSERETYKLIIASLSICLLQTVIFAVLLQTYNRY